jgi:hypothetical protein
MSRRVLLMLLSAAVLVGLIAQPGAAVNVPQAAVVSANPANWTPHVLDGKVDAVVQIGNKMAAGGLFAKVAVSGGRLYIGGTFKTANGVARTALAAVDPVTGALSGDVNLAFTGPGPAPSTSTSSTSPPTAPSCSPSATGPMWPACGATRSSCSTWPSGR